MTRANAAFAIALFIVASGFAVAWHPPIPPIELPGPFPADQVARGAELAAIGDCAMCHTAEDGRPYAGGRGVPTSFGTVYATNITPEPETGIGRWSEEAFRRAMRDGIDRRGRHLCPMPPYPHFTKATDADIRAMYAFFMTRMPVAQAVPQDQLARPLRNRLLLAGWNLMHLGSTAPDVDR